ncbi:hypothetical protein GE21DRAFT_1346180 [Neurospora crassa]|nr:hypothetical protein GE21DRAFT_1346180 [Neurospora crassa]
MSIMLPTKVETDWPLCHLDFFYFNERGRLLGLQSALYFRSTLSQKPRSSLQIQFSQHRLGNCKAHGTPQFFNICPRQNSLGGGGPCELHVVELVRCQLVEFPSRLRCNPYQIDMGTIFLFLRGIINWVVLGVKDKLGVYTLLKNAVNTFELRKLVIYR